MKGKNKDSILLFIISALIGSAVVVVLFKPSEHPLLILITGLVFGAMWLQAFKDVVKHERH